MFAKSLANDQRKEERGKRFQKPKKTATFQRVRPSFLLSMLQQSSTFTYEPHIVW